MSAVEKREALNHAKHAMGSGDYQGAVQYLWNFLDRPHIVDTEFCQYLKMLGNAYLHLGAKRAAASAHLYLNEYDAAWRLSVDEPTDAARVAVLCKRPIEAAKKYQECGWLGHAAIQMEAAGNSRAARVLWEKLSKQPNTTSDPYISGLVNFNLGQACQKVGDQTAARRANITSMHALEAAADGFESRGLRERAFDCYQVLLSLGKDGSFENLAEGYLNCIRILKEDNLKYYVLQYYEDFQKLAVGAGELHAGATLFREAAEFSRSHNLPYEQYYRLQAAEAHSAAGRKTLAEGGRVDLAENAFSAAIDAFNELGSFSQIAQIYRQLSELPLGEKRQIRYAQLAEKLTGADETTKVPVAFPDSMRMDTAYPEIWRLDVVEWEQAGDAAETMGEVLQDTQWPEFTRRRALLCRLHQLAAGSSSTDPDNLAVLADLLGRTEIYPALAPLEHLLANKNPKVRAAVLRAASNLFFKRSFVLVMQGIKDEDANVKQAALRAVAALHFPHAFDPLSRIYRESTDRTVRRTALESIGRISSIESIEVLIEVVRHGDKGERKIAQRLLARADHNEVEALLQSAAEHEIGDARETINQILKQRRPNIAATSRH